MPILDLPPNPPQSETPDPVLIRSSRYGELGEHELVRLLDTLNDDRSKSSFRESIYLSVIIYMIVAWFLLYGPRVLFHQGRIISPADAIKQHELTQLTTPKDLTRHLARNPPAIDNKTMEKLKAERKVTPQPPAPAPKPLPQTPQPQAATPPPQPPPPPAAVQTPQPRPLPPPTPQPQQAAIPDAPHPTFNTPNQTAGDAVRQAARDAAHAGAAGGNYGASQVTHAGGAEVSDGLEAISDLQGVDFDAYFRRLKREIYNTWIPLIPEEARPPLNKRGITQIRFIILPDGRLKIGGMHLDGSTHDEAIDRAAWGSIVGVGQFQPLPAGYHGDLELRFTYYVNTEPK